MKIALIVNSAPPFPVSGSEQQGLGMAARLAARGHEVTVFARRYGGAAIVEPRDGYRLVRVPFVDFGPLRFPTHTWNFDRLFQRHAADADVILAYQTFLPGFLAARARRRHRIPVVLWIRSMMEFQFAGNRRLTWTARRTFPQVDRILLQSERLRAQFLEALGAVAPPDVANRLRERIGIGRNAVTLRATRPSRGTHLLFVGRLSPEKDLATLFRALRRMSPPPAVRIVGDGPLLTPLRAEAARLGLPIVFTGRLSGEALAAEYAGARALVLTSTTEGMPNVILEAMAAGVPVVSTPVGSIPDVVIPGETGQLVPVGDDEALARVLTGVMQDDEVRNRLAQGALNRAAESTWEKVTGELESILADASLK